MENNKEKINTGIEPEQMSAPETVEPAPQEVKKCFCTSCGSALEPGQLFCANCGARAGAAPAAPVTRTAKKKGAGKLVIIIVAAVLVVALAVGAVLFIIKNNKPDFNDMYGDLKGKKWCTIASDGSWMKIDTNPNDVDGDEITDWETVLDAFDEVSVINADLGFNSALHEKMSETTWSQGRQTQENDDYIVSWTYHPDRGLEVMYEIK